MKAYLKEVLLTLSLAIIIFVLLRTFVGQGSEVFDVSMQPTLVEGHRLMVIKLFYTPQRGDIIVFYPNPEAKRQYVKRLIGLPGDTVEVKNYKVYVNGIALNEPYVKEPPNYTMAARTLPEGAYFVLGDNRNHSTDSHYGWTVERNNIVGKAWLRYWPLNKLGNPGNYSLDDQLSRTKSALVEVPR
ncbi:MAG TPA: signal peptidase I [Dehalococcoidales bacterium]|nr:signal peptidase I [Dehalococcoidales bacterium]